MATADLIETGETTQDPVATMVSHFMENSTVKASNGIREVSAAGFDLAMLSQGVSKEDVKRVQNAVDIATTAAAIVAADDLENKVKATPAEDLANDEHRRKLSSIVRIPTHGGKTEVKVSAETVNNIPFRGEGSDGPQTKTTYGRVSTTINTVGRIHKDVPGTISDRMKAALGITE